MDTDETDNLERHGVTVVSHSLWSGVSNAAGAKEISGR